MAASVSIGALNQFENQFKGAKTPKVAVDAMWRLVYGVGAVAPAATLILRMTIPESPRFLFDVKRNPKAAHEGASMLLPGWFRPSSSSPADGSNNQPQANGHGDGGAHQLAAAEGHVNAENTEDSDFPPQKSWHDLNRYLFHQGNWRYLLGTTGTWFLLDFAFYGLGLNNPQMLSIIWYGEPAFKDGNLPDWYSEPTKLGPGGTPYQNFRDNAKHSLVIGSIGAVLGSATLIWLVNHMCRKRLMIIGFSLLAVWFFIIGGIFSSSMYTSGSHVTVAVLYGVCQFFFNLGT